MFDFHSHLIEVRSLYPHKPTDIRTILQNQKQILQGSDADKNRHLPKVLNECLSTLRSILGINVPTNNNEDSILGPVVQTKGDHDETSPIKQFPSQDEMNGISIKRESILDSEIGQGLVKEDNGECGPGDDVVYGNL